MSNILSLQTANSPSLKERVKIELGRLLASLRPDLATSLLRAPTNYGATLRERLVMAFLRERARIGKDARFFADLHREFWSGSGGSIFSANCDHRFTDVFLNQQAVDFEFLQQVWKKSTCKQIIEIGCSSGRLTRFLTKHLPGVSSAVGVDLNESQIHTNLTTRNEDPRIHFQCGDGFDYLMNNGRANTLYVTNGGVLEYFSREQIDAMFSELSVRGPCLFFCVEPIAPDHDWASSRESLPFGTELSFSHNYKDAFESNGFDVLHQRYVDFESWRWMTTIAKSQ